MKRTFLVIFALLSVCGILFAREGILIDFNDLIADNGDEHEATILDYGATIAGDRFNDDEKSAMRTSLYIPNWEVELSSSSRSVMNDSLSYVRPATVKDTSISFPGSQVMAVRVHYPEGAFNSYASVAPPFRIPAYSTNPVIQDAPIGRQFSGFGVLKNVGAIKNIRANVFGLNHPMSMEVVIRKQNNQTQRIPLGDLQFDGWNELSWSNPAYISDVRSRELRAVPLYPRSASAIALDRILFYRDASQEGGDFIVYLKDIKVSYDQAILDEIDTDLEHEEIWGILEDREKHRLDEELSRLGEMQVLQYLEKQKQQAGERPTDSQNN